MEECGGPIKISVHGFPDGLSLKASPLGRMILPNACRRTSKHRVETAGIEAEAIRRPFFWTFIWAFGIEGRMRLFSCRASGGEKILPVERENVADSFPDYRALLMRFSIKNILATA